MMNFLKFISIGVLSATLLAPAYSIADDDTGYYIGVGINRLSADFEDDNDVDFEDSDNAASIKFGYMFTDYIGVEIGYIDLGDYIAEGDTPSNRIDLDADAFSLAVVGNWSVINQLDLYAKAGIYSIDVKSSSQIAGNTVSSNDDEDEEFFATIGVEYDLGHVNFFTEFSVADTDINELNIDIATAGIKYEF